MALGPGRQPLSARSAKGIATALPSPIFSLTRILPTNGTRAKCLLGAKVLEAGRTRRYGCQVLAFKADSSLAKHEASQAGSLACRPGEVRYRFVVPQYVTTFGQTLRVVGSLPELGEWNPELAPVMAWSDGHQWSLECALPQRSFEFKITVFEGHGVKWEGGSNRVVQAEGDDGDVPVEIVVWLTCNFNATTSTQLQLAVPRASIEDAYETGRATLEFLKLRKSKLGHDTDQASSFEQRKRQTTELARLSEAVVEQSTVVHQLSGWLGSEIGAGRGAARVTQTANGVANDGVDDEDKLLLLAIDSVQVPKLLRRISFVQSWNAGHAALALATGDSSSDSSMDGGPHTPNPFLRGELDSRAEDLMSAAEILLQELKSSDAGLQASVEWASLAQEAGQVAVALEALGGGDTASGQATNLQLRGLASVGSALAGGSAPAEPALAFGAAVAGEETPVLQILAAPSNSAGGTVDDGHAAELAAGNGIEQVGQPGAEDGAAALPVTVSSPSCNDGASGGVSGGVVEAAGAVMLGTVAGISAAETVVLGAGLVSAGRTLPQEARGPEMHALQRLAANVKDAVWVGGRPAAAQGGERRPQQLGMDTLAPSSAGGGAAQAAGSDLLQQQEPVAAVRKKWAPPKFNIRAFLDSLFL